MLFRKKIRRCCEYCTHGVCLGSGLILCAKKGMMLPDDRCRKFLYDPLKRIPIRQKAVDFSKYYKDDFSL